MNAMTDSRHDYRTVLHYAVLSGNLAIVNLLIKQGARVNYPPDYQKPTPLDLAILKGDIDLVKLLLAAGKDLRLQYGICSSPCSPYFVCMCVSVCLSVGLAGWLSVPFNNF